MIAEKIKRIALIGPESSGKSTLCELLATHYKTLWIPEYAREYIEKLNRPYTAADILHSAQEQLKMEEERMLTASKFLFADTELIVAKVWCEDVFHFCHPWIAATIEEKKYDLYLLTKPDLIWEKDAVRENPNRRDYFFNLYLNELEERGFNYEIIGGAGEERLRNAIGAVEKNMK